MTQTSRCCKSGCSKVDACLHFDVECILNGLPVIFVSGLVEGRHSNNGACKGMHAGSGLLMAAVFQQALLLLRSRQQRGATHYVMTDFQWHLHECRSGCCVGHSLFKKRQTEVGVVLLLLLQHCSAGPLHSRRYGVTPDRRGPWQCQLPGPHWHCWRQHHQR